MTRVLSFSGDSAQYSPFFGPPGRLDVAPMVDERDSNHISLGLCVFEDCEMPYTLPYEDAMYIIEGTLTFRTAEKTHICGPGDVLWMETGAEGVFIAEGRCKVFYVVSPSNWAQTIGWQAQAE